MRSYWKNSISIFFLATFLLLKVVNIHAVHHIFSDKDAKHCEQCALVAHTNQSTPLDLGVSQTDFSFLNPLEYIEDIAFTLYSAPYQKTLHSDYFYNKPPPNSLLG